MSNAHVKKCHINLFRNNNELTVIALKTQYELHGIIYWDVNKGQSVIIKFPFCLLCRKGRLNFPHTWLERPHTGQNHKRETRI